jgi:Protein of unknown function (DUF3176)
MSMRTFTPLLPEMDDSRTRLYDVSPMESHAPDRTFQSPPKIGLQEEYQGVLYPHATTIDIRNSQKQNRTHGWSDFIKEWWWEILTWLLGSSVFMAIIALLVVFGNQPLDRWKLPTIPITTTVAALAQTATATLIVSVSSCIGQLKWVCFERTRSLGDVQRFDDSSRGPAGSSLLLVEFSVERKTTVCY